MSSDSLCNTAFYLIKDKKCVSTHETIGFAGAHTLFVLYL